jgi:hypothetical protein
MSDKKRSDLLSAFREEAARPAPPAPPAARTPRAAAAPRRAAPAPRGASGQGERRVNLSFRATLPTWERVKQLALSDRVSVQELIFNALSHEFERRGLPALQD